MARYATYKTMPNLIKKLEPFKGNSVKALKESKGYYIIYSYNTVVAIIKPCDRAIINITYYSKSTSRIQHILRALFPNADLMKHIAKQDTYHQNLVMRDYALHLK